MGHDIDPAGYTAALTAVKDVLRTLNGALKDKTFFVGERFTLADAAVFQAAFPPFTLVLDAGFRKAMPHVSAWFERMTKMPEVIKICGQIRLPAKGLKPATASAPKEETKTAQPKADNSKEKATQEKSKNDKKPKN